MTIGTKWICSFSPAGKTSAFTYRAVLFLLEGLWVGTVCKCIVFDWWSNVSFSKWRRITGTSGWRSFLPSASDLIITVWTISDSSSSSICCKSIAQLLAINLAIKAKHNKASPQPWPLYCFTSSHYLTLSPPPRPSHIRRTTLRLSRRGRASETRETDHQIFPKQEFSLLMSNITSSLFTPRVWFLWD